MLGQIVLTLLSIVIGIGLNNLLGKSILLLTVNSQEKVDVNIVTILFHSVNSFFLIVN